MKQKRSKCDPAIYKAVKKFLDWSERKHGVKATRWATNKWVNGQREKTSLLKQRAALERSLAQVSKRLSV